MLADLCRPDRRHGTGSPSGVPRGFIPTLDQGYAIVVVQLPDGASLVAHGRGGPARREDHAGDARAWRTRSPSPASPARPSPTRPTPPPSSPVSSRSTSGCKTGLPREHDHRRAVRAAAVHRGGVHHRHPAAAGAGHRQCRRVQDAAAGAHRVRRRAACSPAAYQVMGTSRPEPQPRRRLHDLHGQFAAGLPRDRPHQGAHAERADLQHLRDAAGQSRHGLRERLQLPSAASTRCAPRPTSASASSRRTSSA